MAEKILLDTDIGSDIDDAVCLAYLLAQPECDLVGITTVSGQPVARARLADALVRRAGRTVPVVPGAPQPMTGPCRQPEAPQAEALSRWPHAEAFGDISALEFQRRIIRQSPGEITLLAVGPMTNLGLLFTADPEIPSLLKRLVLMCGDFGMIGGGGPGEWNAYNDPAAALRVYEARPPLHRSVGLNVTRRVAMPAGEVRARFSRHPLLQPVLDFAEVWFRRAETITFHDPLAAVTLFDDRVCSYADMLVEPEVSSARGAGVTWARAEQGGPHQVAVSVDPDRFFKSYFSVFGM